MKSNSLMAKIDFMNDISFKIGLSYGWGLYFSSV